MARPKRKLFDEIRTRAWFCAVSRVSGLTAYKIEILLGDTSKSWQKYRRGQRVPTAGIIRMAEKRWPGTKHVLFAGPANIFAAANVKSAEEGFRLFMSSALEPRFHGILARFQKETNLRAPPKKFLIAFSRWLIELSRLEPGILPLAVSANLVTTRFFDEDDLSSIILSGAEAFDIQHGVGRLDFVRIHLDLLATFIDKAKELNLNVPRTILAVAREQLRFLDNRSEWRD
jgi:hypothetical protein